MSAGSRWRKSIPQTSAFSRAVVLVIMLAIVIGVLFQIATLIPKVALDIRRTIADIGQPALWRGAKHYQGQQFANFVAFLSQNIPTNSRVVLPPTGEGLRALSSTPVMQFFLMPRKVVNCLDNSCLQELAGPGSYIILITASQRKEKIPGEQVVFDENWGYLKPEGAFSAEGITWQSFSSLVQAGMAFLLPLVWLVGLAGSGLIFFLILLPGINHATAASLGYGLGLAFNSIVLTAASLLRIHLNQASVIAVWLILLSIASPLAIILRGRRKTQEGASNHLAQNTRSDGKSIFPFIWIFAIVVLGLVMVVIAVGKGFSATDEIALWGVKGYGIANQGLVSGVTQWGTNTLRYPLHIPVTIASAMLLFSEVLPASKIVFSGYYIALMIAIYQFLIYRRVSQWLSGLAVILFATVPLIFRHGTLAYANLAMSFYLVSAVFLISASIENDNLQHIRNRLILGGLFFSFAAWTRPEGWALSWIAIILFAFFIIYKQAKLMRHLLWLILPLFIYGLFWEWVKSGVYDRLLSRVSLLSTAVSQFLNGNLHSAEGLYVLKSLFVSFLDIETWGVIGIAILVTLVASVIISAWHKTADYIGITGITFLGAIGVVYFLASYDTNHDISWWVSTGLDRMLIPAVILLWVAGISRVQTFYHSQDRAVSLDLK